MQTLEKKVLSHLEKQLPTLPNDFMQRKSPREAQRREQYCRRIPIYFSSFNS